MVKKLCIVFLSVCITAAMGFGVCNRDVSNEVQCEITMCDLEEVEVLF